MQKLVTLKVKNRENFVSNGTSKSFETFIFLNFEVPKIFIRLRIFENEKMVMYST